MSYDICFGVKVEGTDIIAEIGEPELWSPTYNLGTMFRVATGWDFDQNEWYKCEDIYNNVLTGITELKTKPEKYGKYKPGNGWGTLEGAIRVLESIRDGIEEKMETIPIEHLWIKW